MTTDKLLLNHNTCLHYIYFVSLLYKQLILGETHLILNSNVQDFVFSNILTHAGAL